MENKRQVSKDRGDSVSGEIISVTAKFGIFFFFLLTLRTLIQNQLSEEKRLHIHYNKTILANSPQ